ncbi:MAG: ABC transporter permease [Trueperaceae bacterium]|nr:ABC transporter permease [Trueperaceae bacterium]MCC6311271.1 ABC transporter permease [Trueperaceae bacterium]
MAAEGGGNGLALYALRRLINAVPLVLGVVVVNFVLIALAPGDPVMSLIGEYPAPAEYVERVRQDFGLDKSVPERLWLYLVNVAKGDLGFSFANRQPVLDLLLQRLGRTLVLMLSTVVVASTVGLFLGVIAARKPGSVTDRGATGFALVGYAVPEFWLGQILILVFAVLLGWLPAGGFRSVRVEYTGLAAGLDMFRHMLLPMAALSFRYMAITTRLTRASLLEVMSSQYIVAARGRGLSENTILWRHALRAAALPVVTVIGYNFGFIVAGSALVETVFGWPGIGRLMYDSIYTRDYPVLLGILLFVSMTVIVVNLITDAFYAVLDPRVRY